MKTNPFALSLLCVSIPLLSLDSFAYEQVLDRFQCRATCVTVNADSRTIRNLGSVNGRSEIDSDEAFEVMAQACRNLARTRETSTSADIALVTSMQAMKSEDHKVVSAREETRMRAIGYFFNYRSVSNVRNESSDETQQSFSYHLKMADQTSCGVLESNPQGHPKYIGPDEPLG